MRNRILALMLAGVFAGCMLAGCGTNSDSKQSSSTSSSSSASSSASSSSAIVVEDSSAETEAVTGGWTVYEDETKAALPDDVQEAFDKATEAYTGMEFKPVAYIGSQVVAGTNYQVLCVGTTVTANPESKLVVVTIYQDLDGNAEISSVDDFDIAAYSTEEGSSAEAGLAGGWTVYTDAPAADIEADAAQALTDCTEGLTGATYEPLAILGTQVVAGTNYAILCRQTLATADADTNLVICYVYAPVNGDKAELTNVYTINPADYNTAEESSSSEDVSAESSSAEASTESSVIDVDGSSSEEKSTGGWTVYEDESQGALPDDAQEAFEKATEAYTGMEFKPVAYLGSQVVAGTNHQILCVGTTVTANPESKLVVVTIYQDLDGNAEITNVADFDIAAYSTEEGTAAEENLEGGWTVYTDAPAADIDADAAQALTDCTEELTGATYEPLAILGTQVVAGTNYAILCRQTMVTAEPTMNLVVCYVYAPVNGEKAELTNVYTINLADYNA